MPDSPKIEISNLRKGYYEGAHYHKVIRNLKLTIASKEMVVLLGRSGSGKSTLLNLISGIDLPDSGEIHIGNTNLTALSEYERTLFRRQHIGFVFQSYNLIPTLTVEENVLLPLELNNSNKGEARERALQLLEETGLTGRNKSFPDRLSGGEQQRVAIARALAHNPHFILADEPTGNLDFETGQYVLEILNRLVRKEGRTMLIATHDHDLQELADRVMVLHEGKVQDQKS